jgi:hypothetical protein
MKNMTLLFQTSFPLALDEKIEVRIPIVHAAGTIQHQVRFQIDETLKNKSDIRFGHDTDGRFLVTLPNHKGDYYFNPMGYSADGDRKLFMHFTIQSIEGCNIVQLCLMEHA